MPVVSCARYLLAVHARHGPAGLLFSYRLCGLRTAYARHGLPRAVAARPSRYAYFCAVSHASAASASRLRRVFQKHANLSCIKFSFFAMLASCRTLSCLYVAIRRRLISQPHLSRIHTALAANFSACALNFSLKALFSTASEHKQSHCLFGDAG